jgi:hypothetical protein
MIRIILFLAVWIVVMTGCEYDSPTAMYFQKHEQTITPVITGVIPVQADAGVNYITIKGEYFSDVVDSNRVYFDGYTAEIVSSSTTSITVRRPNRTGDSTTVKVVRFGALETASYGPYKIVPVYESYGGFVASPELSALVVDKEENVYGILRILKTVYKTPVNGERMVIGEASNIVTDAIIGPNGRLILLMNQKEIMQMDVETGTESLWVSLAKKVSYADFDRSGCLYAGGNKTDLYVVKPDLSNTATNFYTQFDIRDVHVYGGYVYVLAVNSKPDAANPKLAIWRNRIEDTNGTLGDKELVLDWSTTGEYAESAVYDIAFSANGIMYIGTGYTSPIFIFNPNGSQDILYKDILPTSAVRLVWGNGNYLYMIRGGQNWDVIRIDMGAPSVLYY